MSNRATQLIKHPIFLLVIAFAIIGLISALGPTQKTYDEKLRWCIDMCRESGRFGRLVAPKRISPKNTIEDYQCQCY